MASIDAAGVLSEPVVSGARLTGFLATIAAVGVFSGPRFPGPVFVGYGDQADPVIAYVSPFRVDLVQPPVDAPGEFVTIYEDMPGRTKLDWVEPLSDVAMGNFELMRKISDGNGDLIPNPALDLWNPDMYVTVHLHGRPVVTLMRGPIADTRVSDQEESQETFSLSNAPSTAYKLHDTILRPPNDLLQYPIQSEVPFDWTSLWCFTEHYRPGDKDFHRWDNAPNAVRSAPRLFTSPDSFYFTPQGWPDINSQWIWDRPGGFPMGTCYFYSLLDPNEGEYQLWTAGLGPYEVWMNGVKVAEETKAFTGQSLNTNVHIQNGGLYHWASPTGTLLAIKATATVPSGVGFMYTLFPLNPDGSIAPVSHARSDTNVRVLSYPEKPPGMTAGNIILSMLVASGDYNGQFRHWDVTFDGSHDSAGKPWPILYGWRFPTGSTVLDALRSLGETDIDWRVHPTSYTLDAFVKSPLFERNLNFPASNDGYLTDIALVPGYEGGNLRKLQVNMEQD